MYTVYILKCSDRSLYTGITNNLKERLKKHSDGKGSKYVRSRLPFELVYTEENLEKSEAMKREIEIKKLNKTEKLLLLKDHIMK